MGADLRGFNADEVEPQVGFEVLPEADYPVAITKSEKEKTKDGTGEFLTLTFDVIEGPQKGRNLWVRLNLWNRSAKAVQFAQAELSAICRAVGVPRPKDSLELHNLPLVVSVKVEKRADTGQLTNVISAYKKRERVPQQPAPAAGPPAEASTAGQPPAQGQPQGQPSWMK